MDLKEMGQLVLRGKMEKQGAENDYHDNHCQCQTHCNRVANSQRQNPNSAAPLHEEVIAGPTRSQPTQAEYQSKKQQLERTGYQQSAHAVSQRRAAVSRVA